MRIAYTLLVVLDLDPESDDAGTEWRELAAQLRLAAHHLVAQGAPEPGEAVRLQRDERVTTYLSAVEL